MAKQFLVLLVLMSSVVQITLASLEVEENNDLKFEIIYNKAYNFRNINSDSVLYYAKLALGKAYMEMQFDNQVKSLILIALTKTKIGQVKSAFEDINQAMSIINESNLSGRTKECLTILGALYQNTGYYNEAMEYFSRAKKLNEDTKNDYVDIVDLDYYIGSLYLKMNKVEEGRVYLKNSAEIAIKHNFEVGAFMSYTRLAGTYRNIDSIQYYRQLSEEIINRNSQLEYEKVVLLNNKALFHKALGNYKQSRNLYIEAISLGKKNQFNEYLATLFNNYAYLLMKIELADSAKFMLGSALKISKQYDFLFLKANVYDSYSDFYVYVQDYKKAYYYKDSSDRVLKEVEKNKQIQQSLFLSTVFETEQKEKEILVQKNRNFTLWIYLSIVLLLVILLTIFLLYYRQKLQLNKARVISLEKDKKLEVANAIIEGQDSERKRLAMDLHDGLGAGLGTLRLTIDSELKNAVKYNELISLIDDIRQSVRDMSHRMMPTRLDKMGLIPSVNNLVLTLSNTGRFNVDFKTNVGKRLPGNLEINIYYLIFELVNNAIKHSNGNNIFVELIDHDDLMSLSVIDNGSDFNIDEFSDGMGLKNVKARVQYMDGELFIDANGQETIFMVEIPVKK